MKDKIQCERIVKQTGNEVTVEGGSFGIANFRVDVPNYSNKIREFYKVPEIMLVLDNSQLLLCRAIRSMENDSQLKDICLRIHLQLVLAFNHLHVLLIVQEQTERIEEELRKWVEYMSELHRYSIESLRIRNTTIPEIDESGLSRISEYQGVTEEQMQEALRILKT